MKFGYNNKKGIIKNYDVKSNKIIITYLNDKLSIKEFSKDEEQNIKDLMLRQAHERDNSIEFKLCKATNTGYKILKGASVILAASGALMSINSVIEILANGADSNNPADLLFGSVGVLALFFGGQSFINVLPAEKNIKKELEELKKYRLFLKIKDDLKNYSQSYSLFNGIEREELGLPDIDTLDYFTLDELKTFSFNVEVLKEYKTQNENTAYTKK